MPQYLGSYSGKRGRPEPFFSSLNRIAYHVRRETWFDRYDSGVTETRIAVPLEGGKADVVSSELPNGQHAPCIDIDVPIRAIPSTTPDHWHLYIEKPMSWWRYRILLKALVWAGVVEPGYYYVSVKRKGTHVRLPWVKKEVSP